MPGRAWPFRAGRSGNPAGRSKGSKNRLPPLVTEAATLLQRLMAPALDVDPADLAGVVRAGLRNPRLALGYLALGAKLTGEIGRHGAGPSTQATVIVVGSGAEAIADSRAAARLGEQDADPAYASLGSWRFSVFLASRRRRYVSRTEALAWLAADVIGSRPPGPRRSRTRGIEGMRGELFPVQFSRTPI